MIELDPQASLVPSLSSPPVEANGHGELTAWWLWGNILSLEAPLAAMLWQLLLAKSLAVDIGWTVPFSLGCAVWTIYLFDHVLDTRNTRAQSSEPARKIFFRRHWHLMVGMAIGALIFSIAFTRLLLDRTLFLSGLAGGMLIVLYFALVHFLPDNTRSLWPREAMVAFLFCAGISLPVYLRCREQPTELLLYLGPLFLLCWVNCCAVELWEWQADGDAGHGPPHRLTRWIGEHVALQASLGLLVGAAIFRLLPITAPYLWALTISAVCFIGIAGLRTKNPTRRQRTNLRSVLIDLALCSPLPVLALWQIRPFTRI